MNFDIPSEFEEKFQGMWLAGQSAKLCLDDLKSFILPGRKLIEIDYFVRSFADHFKLELAQEGYRGFPAACCTSPNHVICHGIPNEKVLKVGDIVSVDVTFIKNGWYGDTCRTYIVDKTNVLAARLIFETSRAMWAGIEKAVPGNTIRDISTAIQASTESVGFSVVRDYVGHGIGREFHMPPSIPNSTYNWSPDFDTVLTPGMTFTVEPMLTAGKPGHKVLNDEWTVVTRDRSLSAQFEHTIGITNSGHVVFT